MIIGVIAGGVLYSGAYSLITKSLVASTRTIPIKTETEGVFVYRVSVVSQLPLARSRFRLQWLIIRLEICVDGGCRMRTATVMNCKKDGEMVCSSANSSYNCLCRLNTFLNECYCKAFAK